MVVLLTAARPKHEYHISVTKINYNSSQKTLEISIRAFTDDLEKGLSQANGNRRILLRNGDENNPLVDKYLRKHFALADPERKLRTFSYIGKEEEADATWLYLEVPFQGDPDGWVMKNELLMEAFDDQVNMVNAKWGDDRKTYLFKKGKSVQAL
ncbi:DUF6702 family protein [Persicitalea jodogahamensis]|uniref:Uncharacterized protein n=1 Tax=Persicitalea jodogahamensis TaxID=402147 RepID=A0A8J3G752_9BACT|nr:DUF6702 family protein [Persicitalea jodogahamensis]GHB53294.1 hypothetical protein GCM10007390_02550 [Persicitalea jodogahamensis]